MSPPVWHNSFISFYSICFTVKNRLICSFFFFKLKKTPQSLSHECHFSRSRDLPVWVGLNYRKPNTTKLQFFYHKIMLFIQSTILSINLNTIFSCLYTHNIYFKSKKKIKKKKKNIQKRKFHPKKKTYVFYPNSLQKLTSCIYESFEA